MSTQSTLLCIHREPIHLSLLKEKGYKLITATNGADGLRLFMSLPADAIVLDNQLGLLDGAAVAAEIKQVKPEIPIVMLAESRELPHRVLKCVDAIVVKADAHHALLETIESVLSRRITPTHDRRIGGETSQPLPCRGTALNSATPSGPSLILAMDDVLLREAPFTATVWRAIRNGAIRF